MPTTTIVKKTSGSSGPPPPPGTYVQRGHTVTTIHQTETTRKRNKRGGDDIVKRKTRTIHYVDGKEVKLNWFDRLRIKFMSTHEKQAFLAEKLLRQEKKSRTRTIK